MIIMVITCAMTLISMNYYVVFGSFRYQLIKLVGTFGLPVELAGFVFWSLGCIIFYFLFPAAILKLLGKNLRDHGLNFYGFRSHMGFYFILYVPVAFAIFIVADNPDFKHTYPFYPHLNGWTELLLWELMYALQFIALEFFFRGFMVHGFKAYVGNIGAVIIMLFPYMMIHFPKPWMETTGALVAGAIFGYLSLRTKSIAGGALIHIMVAWTMDITVLWHKGWFQ